MLRQPAAHIVGDTGVERLRAIAEDVSEESALDHGMQRSTPSCIDAERSAQHDSTEVTCLNQSIKRVQPD